MTEVSQPIAAPVEKVWGVLADGWTYAAWLVGASHIRSVDPGWPAVGSKIHHSVGSWPFVLDDVTAVVVMEPTRMLELEARMWPVGTAQVRLTLQPLGSDRTEVRMEEDLVDGPARQLPKRVQGMFFDPRNKESLRRLADHVEGRHRTHARQS
ncbi:SRPBCC family protein [Actinopolymorpha pittospori]|uniref:Polyketide cyclase / dehydrase and lipid transport n=1 Tax=Actinopolymorpha pittospori TaxID=648752 RepID=A0A927MZM6_9ACTN|nr:SRPBCC family protein [Actinopolymorpha pittospori]MBE1608228.1 hypothetical protein [Actinopolymorpha pittospori]